MKLNFSYQESLSNINGFMRSYPFVFIIISLLLGSVFQLHILLYLILVIIISSIMNSHITKQAAYTLSKYLNVETITLRPKGAKNCSNFINEFMPNVLSNTYGMPSGHSVEAMLISIFLIMYIKKHHVESNKRSLLIALVFSLGASVCISRVYLGCHTILQIILGGAIGSIIGYYSFQIWNTFIEPKWINKDIN